MEKVWGYTFDGSKRTVDVHIRWLRQKIEENPEKSKNIDNQSSDLAINSIN